MNDIFELLVFSRILFPCSILSTYNNRDIFFDKFNLSEQNMYRSLDYFSSYKDEILTLLWNNTKEKYKRDASLSYYDNINYYFEISYNDEDELNTKGDIVKKVMRKKGPSKKHRKTPIIQMGLLVNKISIPMYYNLFPVTNQRTSNETYLKKRKGKVWY